MNKLKPCPFCEIKPLGDWYVACGWCGDECEVEVEKEEDI